MVPISASASASAPAPAPAVMRVLGWDVVLRRRQVRSIFRTIARGICDGGCVGVVRTMRAMRMMRAMRGVVSHMARRKLVVVRRTRSVASCKCAPVMSQEQADFISDSKWTKKYKTRASTSTTPSMQSRRDPDLGAPLAPRALRIAS